MFCHKNRINSRTKVRKLFQFTAFNFYPPLILTIFNANLHAYMAIQQLFPTYTRDLNRISETSFSSIGTLMNRRAMTLESDG